MKNNLEVSKRTQKLRVELLNLLDGAASHPEIGKTLPKCKAFFKKMTEQDFINLIDSCADSSDPVYIALWYHCGETMKKATEQCALFTPGRMKALYPIWREYADEADGYGRPGRKKKAFLPNFAMLGKQVSRILNNAATPKNLHDDLMNFLNDLFNNSSNKYLIECEDNYAADYIEQLFRSYFQPKPSVKTNVRPFKSRGVNVRPSLPNPNKIKGVAA